MIEYEQYIQSADYIRKQLKKQYKIAIVLGSGLGGLKNELENKVEIKYRDIPNFPVSTAPGHEGVLAAGELNGVDVIVLCGRFHCYEGYTMEESAYYVRVLKLIGINTLILTNAAGAINTTYSVGDFMVLSDHINFSGYSPLTGKNLDKFGVRFPDVSYAYTPELRKLAISAAEKLQIRLHEGIYAYMPGPQYETPAEVRALGILGADAVGMSTVAEDITAVHAGMKVLALSCMTDMAAGIFDTPVREEEVISAAQKSGKQFAELIKETVKEIERL